MWWGGGGGGGGVLCDGGAELMLVDRQVLHATDYMAYVRVKRVTVIHYVRVAWWFLRDACGWYTRRRKL